MKAVKFLLLIVIAAMLAWSCRPPAAVHVAAVFDKSRSMNLAAPAALGVAEHCAGLKGLHKKSTITFMATGGAATAGEPTVLGSFYLGKVHMAMEGYSNSTENNQLLDQVGQAFKDFKNTETTSPIYLAVRRGVQYLRAQGCEPCTTICYLVVVSDGQETVEPAMVDALNGRAAPNNLKSLAINNESIRVLFCGLSQTNAMTPERTSASSERLEAVWKSMFAVPDLVSFDPFCWQITKGADNASH